MNNFSVVIPAYNAEDYLTEQLEALLRGTVDVPEIIISDNGSTDSTKNIALSFSEKHKNITYVDSGQRQGPNYARNRGIHAAKNDVILLCDADDIVAETWAEKLVQALESADVVGSGYYHYRFNEVSGRYETGSASCEQPHVFNGRVYSLSCSMGMTRAAFAAVGGFDESYVGGHEEVDFCLRASAAGLAQGWVAEPLIQYRQRLSARGLARQSRLYGRTWVQLAENFSPEFDDQVPGLKLMLRKVLTAMPGFFLQRQSTWDQIRGFWWNVGVLEGVIRYRWLGGQPPRQVGAAR